MRWLSWLAAGVLVASACARSDAGQDQAANNKAEHQRMLAEVEATHARYRAVLEAFLQALGAPARYGLRIAGPVYQHTV
jgi:hypothetical protein